MRIAIYRPGSDDPEVMTKGYALVDRINDVTAKPESKRFRRYLRFVTEQFAGEDPVDPAAPYRDHSDKIARALHAYQWKHKVRAYDDRIYFHDSFAIAGIPHGVVIDCRPCAGTGKRLSGEPCAECEGSGLVPEKDRCGLLVHCRENYETYRQAVIDGPDHDDHRKAQAFMWLTGLRRWRILDYLENVFEGPRKLHDKHVIEYSAADANELENALIGFVAKSRRTAERSAA